jgi:hypothetical protein
LASATIRLFGRPFAGLQLQPLKPDGGDRPQNLLANQLDPDRKPHLAQIYGFTYLGTYYPMTAPAVFLVHGAGTPIISGVGYPAVSTADGGAMPPDPEKPGYTFAQANINELGAPVSVQGFAAGLVMWPYHDVDFSVRIDIATGMLQDILLAVELPPDPGDGSTAGALPGRPRVVQRSAATARSTFAARTAFAARAAFGVS